MHRLLRFLILAGSVAPVAAWAQTQTCTQAAPNFQAGTGSFGILNGQWYTPNGKPFVPHGINVMEGQDPPAADILAKFPGTNFVRYAVYDFADPSKLQALVNDYTAHGIFVELEDHSSSDGQNRGGSTGTIFTGQTLTNELNWYSQVAAAFKNNPYVGFGTNNEPSEVNPSTGQTDASALSNWQLATYRAIRSAGNNNPIWMEATEWADPNSMNQGYDPSAYATMTNVAWDMHIYPWLFDTGASASDNQSKIAQFAANAQKIKSADGNMPVNILEGGNSTTGQSIDSNGDTTVQAITGSNLGYAAWAWGSGNPGDGLLNNSTQYPAMVAAYIATSGASGCPEAAIGPAVTALANGHTLTTANAAASAGMPNSSQTALADAAPTDASTALDGSNLTLDQVATIARQSAQNTGQSIDSTAQVADGTGPADGSALTSLNTIAGAAAANAPATITATPILATNSPGGTSPTPGAVSGSTSYTANGNYQTVAGGAGNATGTVSGSGNAIVATGGTQTVTVTGSGNTMTFGPYNDTVTLSAAGNTVDGGGGNDTVVLSYGGGTSVKTNGDLAAVAPLAAVGNTLIAPAPGTGTMTIQGTLASNDKIDLTRALAGVAGWDHNSASIWHYVDATATASGCTLSVGGKVIVAIPGGSPNGNIGNFVTAH